MRSLQNFKIIIEFRTEFNWIYPLFYWSYFCRRVKFNCFCYTDIHIDCSMIFTSEF